MLREHLPHPGWQPLWYCGTRFDYVYPPALRYGTALISLIDHLTTARAYHMYTGLLYSIGPLAVYLLVLAGSGSRIAAWVSAAATALLSPSFLLLPIIRYDSNHWVPQRLHVLMSYGEGPHISALSLLPAALALSWIAVRDRRLSALAGAGVLCALAVANNFYGATALAMFFPIAIWSIWIGQRDLRVWLYGAAIPALAYLLSAFWLTPSYLRITVLNLQFVSQPGNNWSRITVLIVAALFCSLSYWWGRGRMERSWVIFVASAAVAFSLDVLGFYYFGFRVVGEPGRLVPELDLALIVAEVEVLRQMWKHPAWRPAGVFLSAAMFVFALPYLRHAWSPFPKANAPLDRREYRITKWVHDHLPGQRVLPPGTVRFWFDAWFDNAQSDGGSEQGLLNRLLPIVHYQIFAGNRGDLGVLWLQALGTDAVIVQGKNTPDAYHDYPYPDKFRGLIPAIYEDQEETVIYRVPRNFPGIGRVVNLSRMAAITPVRGGDDFDTLSRYVNLIEDPDQTPVWITWSGFDAAAVQATVLPGQAILVQETYDPAWRAVEGSTTFPVRRDPMNFMLIEAPPGRHSIKLRFDTPLENRAGQVCFFIGLAAVAALCFPGRKRGQVLTRRSRAAAPASMQ